MSVERYSHVMHIVSDVKGRLAKGMTAFDALRATLPVGTVTGAPKIRAMQIIDELEPTQRSVYTGSIGYLGLDGAADLNIAIRTILVNGNRAFFQVGGGIVADSDAAAEYQETLDKGQRLFQALGGRHGPAGSA
jgi:anthranilate/para-aminobenzoate synthase component I